jgi:hypothetical protein
MALQNRVAPDGSLHSAEARGTLTGNRGIIHDPDTKLPIGRRWTTKAWIACALEWKGVRRDVWGRNRQGRPGWSELFFLDEVTALAAGHRPCFACRRADAKRFAEAFAIGNELSRLDAPGMDEILHCERRLSSQQPPRAIAPGTAAGLPEGAMIASGDRFFAVRGAQALPWSFKGYGAPVAPAGLSGAILVTPLCVVAALDAGYRPQWHLSAGA